MDPRERLTRKLARFFRERRAAKAAPGPAAVRFEDQRDRFTVLAALLAGEAIEVLPARDGPGMHGATLLLPPHIDAFEDPERNAQAYVYRIAFSLGARAGGFVLEGGELDADQRLLALLSCVPAIDAALETDYPGIAALRAQLSPALRAQRPVLPASSPRAALEALVRVRLGADPAEATRGLGLEARAAFEDLLGVRADDPARLRETALRAHEMLRSHWRGLGKERVAGVVLWGELPSPSSGAAPGTLDAHDAAARTQSREGSRAIELRRAVRLRRIRTDRREDRPLFHAFEKIETAEDYRGESATPDPEQQIERMDDALQDLSLATVVRTEEDPGQLARADMLLDPAELEAKSARPDPAERVFLYPEWNHKKRRYLRDHCTLYERRPAPEAEDADPDALLAAKQIAARHRRQIDDVRMQLLRGLFRRNVRRRQAEGPDIDVEAMVERHADLRAGCSPPERLYLAARKTPRDIAVLLLLDTSFSTDAWIEGRRVLDIEIESLLVLAAAFEGYVREEIAVAAFHSQTRNAVHFDVLKDFGDGFTRLRKLAPRLAPQGYTRIGAAVRHATALLEAERARHKLLLLVSDGKPTDFDRYEGRHGFEDVAMAVREAAALGVHTFGLAIEKEAKFHLARMLGRGSYRILPRIELLPEAMTDAFVRLWTA